MAIFGQKPKTLWKNVNFSSFWTCCFYSLERRFLVVEYHKRRFPGLYCLIKKVAKMAIIGPKPRVNPFGKMSIFRLFSNCCFDSLERRFLSLEYHKRQFPGLYCLKKSWKNGHCLTLWKNVNFSTFFNLLFLRPRKAFFVSRIS